MGKKEKIIDYSELIRELKYIFNELKKINTLRETRLRINELHYEYINKGGLSKGLQSYISLSLATILMHQQNEIPKFADRPFLFLSNLYSRMYPIEKNKKYNDSEYIELISKENQLIREQLKEIKPEFWSALRNIVKSEYVFYFWNTLNRQKEEEYSIDQIITNIKDKYDVYLKCDEVITYNKYLEGIERELLNHQYFPDLILIDTILLSEYRAKGTFEAIGHYLSEEIFNEGPYNKDSDLSYIGNFDNGVIEALPLTRNFHLPAYYETDDPTRSKFHFPVKHEAYIELLTTKKPVTNLVKVGSNEINNLFDRYKDVNISVFTRNIINDDNSLTTRDKQILILNMGNKIDKEDLEKTTELPLILMQCARDAHIAYTVFAYFGNKKSKIGEKIKPRALINVSSLPNNQSYTIKLWEKSEFVKIANNFLKIIYYFVPYVSLCLDQIKTSYVREEIPNDWFDPCLPIESEVFDINKLYNIKYADFAMINPDGYPLSCIGGYCIALTTNSVQKHDAANLAKIITEKFDNTARNLIKEDNIPDDINMRIALNQANDFGEKAKDIYKNIPDNIARRPHFSGWKNIEKIISDCFRRQIIVIMIHRSIYYELLSFKGKKQRFSEKIPKQLISNYKGFTNLKEQEIIENISHTATEVYFIKNVLNADLVKSHIKCIWGDLYEYFDSKIAADQTKTLNLWMISNMEQLINECDYIVSILKKGVKDIKDSDNQNARRNKFINNISKDLCDTFYSAIRSECANNDWEFEVG